MIPHETPTYLPDSPVGCQCVDVRHTGTPCQRQLGKRRFATALDFRFVCPRCEHEGHKPLRAYDRDSAFSIGTVGARWSSALDRRYHIDLVGPREHPGRTPTPNASARRSA